MLRAFLAIDPPPSLHPYLKQVLDHLQASNADVRWVPVGNIHLTLKFFGQISEDLIPTLTQAITPLAAAQTPFTLHLTTPGAFPTLKNPRVVWLGVSGDLKPLTHLVRQLEAAFLQLGFPPEDRPFAPHLTLGRLRSPKGRQELCRRLTLLPALDCPPFLVQNIVLFQSLLSPKGATYVPLKIIPLGQQL